MTGKTHQVIGILTGTAVFLAMAEPEYAPATLAAVVVGSHFAALLPDIDTASASIWQQLPCGRFFGVLADPFLDHRNITHSLLGIFMVAVGLNALFSAVPTYWGLNTDLLFVSWISAYVSHLLADMATVEGIPLLFPYPRMFGIPPRPFQGVRIITGKWFENLVIFPAVNVGFLALLWYNADFLRRVLFR